MYPTPEQCRVLKYWFRVKRWGLNRMLRVAMYDTTSYSAGQAKADVNRLCTRRSCPPWVTATYRCIYKNAMLDVCACLKAEKTKARTHAVDEAYRRIDDRDGETESPRGNGITIPAAYRIRMHTRWTPTEVIRLAGAHGFDRPNTDLPQNTGPIQMVTTHKSDPHRAFVNMGMQMRGLGPILICD